ncbi:MAG TPA: SDR family oxidoreductase [Candidatus Limnocylindrales bacterium]|nr:SDR family oxidoreductase [Candidatus Limnocylindrales bacterium]
MTRFEGKGVVVTGAAQGIGRAVARAFAAEGAGVVMVDNEADVLATTAKGIREAGGRVETVHGDVSRRDDVRRAVDLAVERFGHVDAAVQVAGIADFIPFLEVSDESWDRILNVNLRGAWYLAQEAGRVMMRDGIRGAIVLTASTNAFQPEAGGLAYNTSKSGQVAVMHTAALELSKHGIRVNAIAPGIINTRLSAFVINNPESRRIMLDRIPIGRFAEPDEMARPILWMCSDDASYLTGHLMVVDGALSTGLPEPGEMDTPLPGAVR